MQASAHAYRQGKADAPSERGRRPFLYENG